MGWLSELMDPLYYIVSSIMVAFHRLLTAAGLPAEAGATWALSIVGLVIVIRILLIPLFVRQIKGQRALQIIQPEVQELQKKYKHDRERQSKELMQLYKDRKANPFASCIPILAQAPIFFALFWLLDAIADPERPPEGVLTQELVNQAREAELFGAELFSTLLSGGLPAKVIGGVLIVVMTLSTFWQQRQLIMKNMPPAALEGQFAKQQKLLMYLMPGMFLITGLWFPIGVLIYWCTTNLWSLGQQMYVIERMPAPGSPAEQKMLKKRAAKGLPPTTEVSQPNRGEVAEGDSQDGNGASAEGPTSDRKRKQPQRQPRSKRR